MRNINVGVFIAVGVLTGSMIFAVVESLNIVGYVESNDVTGKAMVASTCKDDLTFTDTGLTVKLRNVLSTINCSTNMVESINYYLPTSITLEGVEIGGISMNLTTNAFEGFCIYLDIFGYSDQPVIVYMTVPSETKVQSCRLILTEAHVDLIEEEKRKAGEQKGISDSLPPKQLPKPAH